jgi:NADPH2:quinone reductase
MNSKAIGFSEAGDVNVLKNISISIDDPSGYDVIIKNRATTIHSVEGIIRGMGKDALLGSWSEDYRVQGLDGAGVIHKVGPEAKKLVKPGDQVWYGGHIHRQGSNSEYMKIDGRLVAERPQNWTWAEAAGLAAEYITARELFVERMKIQAPKESDALLIINGAGGFGSAAIQLARILGFKTIIATASRPETIEWAKQLGASHVINHRQPLETQFKDLGIPVNYVVVAYDADKNIPIALSLIEPLGTVGSILSASNLNTDPAMKKSVSIVFEDMLTKTTSPHLAAPTQGEILKEATGYIEQGRIKPIVKQTTHFNLDNLKKAHEIAVTNTLVGKLAFSIGENSFGD